MSGAEPRGARKELSLPALFSARTAGSRPEPDGGMPRPFRTRGPVCRSPSPSEGKNDPEGPGLHYQFSLTCPKAADLSLIKAQKKNTVFRGAGPAGARFWGGLPPWGKAMAADSGAFAGPALASDHSRSLTPRVLALLFNPNGVRG